MSAGDCDAIDSNAAAVASGDEDRLSTTNRFSGRTNHSDGSQWERNFCIAVTSTFDAGANFNARLSAFCRRVRDAPRWQYCTGAAVAPAMNPGVHSGP